MNNMVERVARAIWKETGNPPFPWETLHVGRRQQLMRTARAAIAAMREDDPRDAEMAAEREGQ